MKNNNKVGLKISILILFVMIAVIFVFNKVQSCGYERVKITSPWEIQYQGKTYYCNNLSQQSLPVVKKGDYIQLSTVLSKYPFEQAVLEFVTHCSVVNVYIDDKLIYQYGEEKAANNELVGSGIMYAPLVEDYAGKKLTITMAVCEDGVFTKVSDVYIQDTKYYIQNILYNNVSIVCIVPLMLVIGGIILPLVTVFAGMKHLKAKGALYAGGFSVVRAIWLLCYSDIGLCFTNDYHLLSTLAYLCLYSAPVLFGFFIYELIKRKYSKIIMAVCVSVFLIFDIVAITLNQCNIIHFPKTLNVFHILMLVDCTICFVLVCLELFAEGQKEVKALFVSIVLFIVIIIAEMTRYWIDKYFVTNIGMQRTFITIAGLILIIGMIISFGVRLKKEISEKMEMETLEYIAHTDALTKVGNRLSCEETFSVYDTEKKPAVVINFDLNSFKEINDTLGHRAGDEVLIVFADILKKVFDNMGFVGRMGGDEFIVVSDYIEEKKILQHIKKMEQQISEYNDKNSNRDSELSVSYGWADNYGSADVSIWKVYEMADRRMYQCKRNK